jgi:hypothetical protein
VTDNVRPNQLGFPELAILSILIFRVSTAPPQRKIRHRLDAGFLAGFFAQTMHQRAAEHCARRPDNRFRVISRYAAAPP